MTRAERDSFEDFLANRVKSARAVWDTAKQAKPLNLEISHDAPSPDGTLLRSQAQAIPELALYASALGDLTSMTLRGTYTPELLAAWRATQPAERKPFGSACALDSSKVDRKHKGRTA